jgi:hypothetical protein
LLFPGLKRKGYIMLMGSQGEALEPVRRQRDPWEEMSKRLHCGFLGKEQVTQDEQARMG